MILVRFQSRSSLAFQHLSSRTEPNLPCEGRTNKRDYRHDSFPIISKLSYSYFTASIMALKRDDRICYFCERGRWVWPGGTSYCLFYGKLTGLWDTCPHYVKHSTTKGSPSGDTPFPHNWEICLLTEKPRFAKINEKELNCELENRSQA